MIVNSIATFYSTAPVVLTTDEKLPIKAANSLPEFFQEEFPTFQKFIDTYYQYQQQSKEGYVKIESIRDLDAIGEKYLDAFYRTFADRMPKFPYMGMADFIRNAKRFYVSRGSEESFRFLFRIMFGSEIEFKYPKENMLKPSSGKWVQKVSVYVEILVGTIDDTIIGKKLLVKDSSGSTVALVAKGYTQITPTIFEVEVANFVSQTVVSGARVFALQNPQTLAYELQGEITTTLNQYSVSVPGVDFKLGSVFEYTSPAGLLSFRITALDDNLGVKRIEFLSFPGEYTGTDVTFTFSGASIIFKKGSVNRYTGYYDNTDGFLSNNSKLQDSYFYQIFSYVIKSNVSRELYEDLVTRILHPAGLIMFSEYERGDIHALDIQSSSEYLSQLDIQDAVQIYDAFSRTFEGYRDFSDSLSITDQFVLEFIKVLSDTVSITDTGLISYWKAGTYTEPGYWVDELYTTDDYQTRTI